jgi:hypothetical protein
MSQYYQCHYRIFGLNALIYQSSDSLQPKVVHENTCAHDMNVVSTASVLPRTPADIAQCCLLLLWLRAHNHLYANIPLDEEIMNMYPEDGSVPGINEGVC